MRLSIHLRALRSPFSAVFLLDRHGLRRRSPRHDLGRAHRRLQGAGAGIRTRHRPQGADRLRPVDGHDDQRHSGAARARRAGRRADHGRLCAGRSRRRRARRSQTARSISSSRQSAVAVKSGTPKPDISTPDALKRALLAVKTVAYSDSASGVYVSTEMFEKLGIAEEMKDKARKIPATPGRRDRRAWRRRNRLSADERTQAGGRHRHCRAACRTQLQKITIFSAGIATVSKEPDAGKALIKFLASPAARDEIVKSGMDPIAAAATN